MTKTAAEKVSISFPKETTVRGKKVLYDRSFAVGFDAVIGLNDVSQFLTSIPDESVRLVVSSPPYNIGKPYEKRVEFRDYLNQQQKVLRECVRVLKLDGSICWEIGNYVEKGEVFPLDIFYYNILKPLGLKLRNRIVWQFGHGLHASKRFSGRYETVLWFTKGDKYVFNLDAVRIPHKYPGKRAYKGPNHGQPTSHPLGKNPSDVWNLQEEWESGIWEIPNVKSNHPEKTIHPAQFPIELVERIVLALTKERDIVFDPYVGVGSSIIAAVIHDRIGVGCDKERLYADLAYDRTMRAITGTLRKRPLGKPVWQPTGTEKVSKPPPEWGASSLSKFISK
jgi:adenine-specific DNA-methyltransferase